MRVGHLFPTSWNGPRIAWIFCMGKKSLMVSILFIGAAFLACGTEPMEALDTTEAELKRAPDPEVNEYDPAYLDDLAERTLDMLIRVAPRLDADEIDQVLAGEMSSQEALEMDEREFSILWREIEGLGSEAEAVLKDEAAWREVATVYKKNGVKCDKKFKFCVLPVLGAMLVGGPGPGTVVGVPGAMYCYCSHCKGIDTLDKLCGNDEGRPE